MGSVPMNEKPCPSGGWYVWELGHDGAEAWVWISEAEREKRHNTRLACRAGELT